MRRRRRTGQILTLLFVLILGAAGGAFLLSLFLQSQESPAPPMERPDVRVEVLNGCGVDGAADRVASILRRGGFRVEHTGNADHFHYRRDVIVIREGTGREAEDISRLLDGATVVEQRVPAYPYEITVVVGEPHPLVPER